MTCPQEIATVKRACPAPRPLPCSLMRAMLTYDAFSPASGPVDIKARAKAQTRGATTHWRVVVQPRALERQTEVSRLIARGIELPMAGGGGPKFASRIEGCKFWPARKWVPQSAAPAHITLAVPNSKWALGCDVSTS